MRWRLGLSAGRFLYRALFTNFIFSAKSGKNIMSCKAKSRYCTRDEFTGGCEIRARFLSFLRVFLFRRRVDDVGLARRGEKKYMYSCFVWRRGVPAARLSLKHYVTQYHKSGGRVLGRVSFPSFHYNFPLFPRPPRLSSLTVLVTLRCFPPPHNCTASP